jgi:glycosyltransferase involved in cell wall biosynthesis
MRICLVTPELPPFVYGGIGAYVLSLAEGYAQRGHDTTVVGYRIHAQQRIRHDWGESISLDRANARVSRGLRRRLLSHVVSCAESLRGRLKQGFALPVVWRLFDALSVSSVLTGAMAVRNYLEETGDKYDIVEVSNWPGHGALLPVLGCRYVVRLSTPFVDTSSPWAKPATWCEALTCRHAHALVAHSEAMRQKGLDCYSPLPSPVRVVYLGIKDRQYQNAPPACGPLSVLYIGRAEHRKGTDLLIKALAEVMPSCPDLHIGFLGTNVDSYANIHADIRAVWSDLKAKYGNRISLMGRVSEEEKCEAIGKAHWVLIPSRFESFGLVAVEAMRAGTPVIVSTSGGLREIAMRAEGSVLVRPDDVGDLVRGLKEAYEGGPSHAVAMRASARAAYLRWFSADRMVDESLQCYHDSLLTVGR